MTILDILLLQPPFLLEGDAGTTPIRICVKTWDRLAIDLEVGDQAVIDVEVGHTLCCQMNSYQIQNRAEVWAKFTDPDDNALFDPDSVSVTFEDPSGDYTTYVYDTDEEVVKTGTGQYRCTILVDAPGIWNYRWFSGQDEESSRWEFFEATDVRAVETP